MATIKDQSDTEAKKPRRTRTPSRSKAAQGAPAPRGTPAVRAKSDVKFDAKGPAPDAGVTFVLQNPGSRFTRKYELVGVERVDETTMAVKARPIFKDPHKPGKERVVGFLRLLQNA